MGVSPGSIKLRHHHYLSTASRETSSAAEILMKLDQASRSRILLPLKYLTSKYDVERESECEGPQHYFQQLTNTFRDLDRAASV